MFQIRCTAHHIVVEQSYLLVLLVQKGIREHLVFSSRRYDVKLKAMNDFHDKMYFLIITLCLSVMKQFLLIEQHHCENIRNVNSFFAQNAKQK